MTKTIHQRILELIRDNDLITTAELTRQLGVSRVTLRGSMMRILRLNFAVTSGTKMIGKVPHRMYSITPNGIKEITRSEEARLSFVPDPNQHVSYTIQDHEKDLASMISSARQVGRFGILINQIKG